MKEENQNEYSDEQVIKGIEKLCQDIVPESEEDPKKEELTEKEKQFLRRIKAKNEQGGN